MTEYQITNKLEEIVEKKILPGCALRVRKAGEVVFEGCAGYADIENRIPVTFDTIYRQCSMTKLVTAVAVMQLVEKGKLSLDQSLLSLFPHYNEDKRGITVRHLLSHSCGLGQSEISMRYYRQNYCVQDDLAARVDSWADMPLDCPEGTCAAYSPVISFDLLGRIIEITSGEELRGYIDRHIVKPLGMKDSAFTVPEEKLARKAKLYEGKEGELVPASDAESLNAALNGYTSGCGGLYSTLNDYDRFTTMLYYGGSLEKVQIMKPETLWLMRRTEQVTADELYPGARWGLGFLIFQHPERTGRSLGNNTFGWSGAYGTHMYVDMEHDICMTLMAGRKDIGGADSVASKQIEDMITGFW